VTRRRVLISLLLLAATALAVNALIGNGDELVGALDLVGRPQALWLALAIVAEALSYLAYAAGQRQLIGAALDRPPGIGWLVGLATSAQAIANVLPAGYALSGIYSFRMLMRRGLGPAAIAWVVLVTAALYMSVLAVIGLGGAQLGGDKGSAGDVRLASAVLLGVVALLVIAGFALRRTGAGRRLRRRAVAQLEQAAARTRAQAGFAERLDERVGRAPHATRAMLAISGGFFAASWLLDAACLAASFAAIGATPPWRGLLLAYCAGQLAAVLPFTPGGLGLVEGSLTLALVAYGGAATSTLAAVLLYRLISYWALMPAGGIGYLAIRRTAPPPVETELLPT
jgi:uncharacterized protein (TIRG00374 family)